MLGSAGGDEMGSAPFRDTRYYQIPITFKVENTLFRVPKSIFEKNSPVFRDMFSIPTPDGGGHTEGTSDLHPVDLQVSRDDFRYLLEVLYPLSTPSSVDLPHQGWIAALRLATMWEMTRVRQLAISKIREEDIGDPAQQIIIGRELHVPQWLRVGYRRLTIQQEMPSGEDFERLGQRSCILVYQSREFYRQHYEIEGLIDRVFKNDISAEESANQVYSQAD